MAARPPRLENVLANASHALEASRRLRSFHPKASTLGR
jgi:hypothetical protein